MPLNGTGTYTPPAPEYPAIAGEVILASDFNAIIADMAASMSQAIYRDGQQVFTADQPMGGFKLTGWGGFTGTALTGAFTSLTYTGDTFDLTGVTTLNLPSGATATTQTAGTSNTSLATTAFVSAVAFSAALPAQTGNAYNFVTTNGTVASWTNIINFARGTVAMHATTMDLWAQPNTIDATGGVVTVTAIANAPRAGATRLLYPTAGSILTNGATFAIDGSASVTAAAGDSWLFEAITTSTYKVHVVKGTGRALVEPTPVRNYQAFTASGTWTKPTGCSFVYVEVWSAGGGGANSSSGAALLGGASGGEWISGMFQASALAATVTITIGAGGAGAAAGVGVGGGSPGGASSFGAHLAAVGGNGSATTVNEAATVPRSPLASQLQTTGEFRSIVLPQAGGGGSSVSGYTAGRNTIYGGGGGGASAGGAGGVSAYGGNGGAGSAAAATKAGNGVAPAGGGGSSENDGGGGDGARGEIRVWSW